MRYYTAVLSFFFIVSFTGWEHDFGIALQKAKKEHKLILLNFSGSDWCVPCIRLHKEVFANSSFKIFADSNLILVNADFPRLKKNQLSKEQQKMNEELADKYNPQGSFPYTVLVDEEGKVIWTWEGYPNLKAEQFAGQLKTYVDAHR